MNKIAFSLGVAAVALGAFAGTWPDGSEMSPWFEEPTPTLGSDAVKGKVYRLIDCGIYPDDAAVRTREIQGVIDQAAKKGGGTIVVTPGVFKTGAIFLKPGVDLHLMPGAVLLGSDDIADYPLRETRIEGQTCHYFPALINAHNCDNLTISGSGTIDGNGLRAWKSFWIRRTWNRKCTNKDEQRPRLLYVEDSKNVRVDGVNMQNSWFWTSHFHRCDFLRITNCRIYALSSPKNVKGPSTDGIDLDACNDVVVRNVWIDNNDDGVCLKGGKGAFADDYAKFTGNGDNNRILIEHYTAANGTHSAVTLGSESVRCSNVIFRDSRLEGCGNALNLKMRVDTPQHYSNVVVDNVDGWIKGNFLLCCPWSQFADFEGRSPADLLSCAENVRMRNCEVKCGTFFNTNEDGKTASLKNFKFENLKIEAKDPSRHEKFIDGVVFENCEIKQP